jgi:TetR/AcrR family transcriptional regulator
MDAATALMRERNTIHIPFKDIADRAEANSALIKYHFGSKHDLVLAVAKRDSAHLVRALSRLCKQSLPAREKMAKAIEILILEIFKYPYLNALNKEIVREFDQEAASQIENEVVRPLIGAIRSLVQQGVKEGVFRPIDEVLFFYTLTGACCEIFSSNAIVYERGRDILSDRSVVDDILAHTTTFVLGGLSAR